MDDLLADFVAETREMLEASEGEIIAWEADPADRSRLDAIFRFVHTVKGNCGFFDFPRLAELSHAAEDALGDVRAGRREADSELVSAVLAVVDRIMQMVDAIEIGEEFPDGGDTPLIDALQASQLSETKPENAATQIASEVDEPAVEASTSQTNVAQQKRSDIAVTQRTIRLPVELLDRVMSGVSDMVLARNDLAHRLRQAGTQPTIDGPFERLTTILSDVRDAITRMRMQRIETLFSSLPRMVRDLSAELGKQVLIDLEGGNVELDREMLETVRDPLTHIIRNAIDHGIEKPADRLRAGKRETGMLSIAAHQSGNTISIVVSDDGRGLDEDKIAEKAIATGLIHSSERNQMSRDKVLQLIFQPGFSTAEQVSSISGRGVGLDVVRDNLERVGGSIKVSSTPHAGTVFTLQIPLTLSIIAGLTVEVGTQRFAIPQSYVEEIVHTSASALDWTIVGETDLITFRGQRTPCLRLSEVLGLEQSTIDATEPVMVMLRLATGDLFALAVDRIHAHGDLVVKPLAPAVMRCGLYAGSTLLDDGQPVLLLDVANIAIRYGLMSDARKRVLLSQDETQVEAEIESNHAMLFTDYDGLRRAVRLELVQRIETINADQIEIRGERARVVIDGLILPLIGLPEDISDGERIRLLRLSDEACELLYAVREVEDAITLKGALKPVKDDPLVEAFTLVENRSVALIDAHELFARYGQPPEITAKPTCLVPNNDWAQTILRPLVQSAGYEVVVESSTTTHGADVAILLDDEAPKADDPRRIIKLRSQPDALADEDSIYRYDRDGLFAALREARSGGQ